MEKVDLRKHGTVTYSSDTVRNCCPDCDTLRTELEQVKAERDEAVQKWNKLLKERATNLVPLEEIKRLRDARGECVWSQDEWDEWGLWESECGQGFCLEDGDPTDSGMRFCPYCGKLVKQALKKGGE